MTAQALLFYAPALFAHSGIEILSRGFYALGDTRTPVTVAVAAMLIIVALAATLVGPLEVRGIALALSLATTLEFAALFAMVAKRIPALSNREMQASLARMVLACGVMAAAAGACLAALRYGTSLDLQSGFEAFAAIVICAAAGAVTYAAASLALGVAEMGVLLGRMRGMVTGAG